MYCRFKRRGLHSRHLVLQVESVPRTSTTTAECGTKVTQKRRPLRPTAGPCYKLLRTSPTWHSQQDRHSREVPCAHTTILHIPLTTKQEEKRNSPPPAPYSPTHWRVLPSSWEAFAPKRPPSPKNPRFQRLLLCRHRRFHRSLPRLLRGAPLQNPPRLATGRSSVGEAGSAGPSPWVVPEKNRHFFVVSLEKNVATLACKGHRLKLSFCTNKYLCLLAKTYVHNPRQRRVPMTDKP